MLHNLFDFQKLYQKYTSLQKLVSQLREEIKVKNKTILELQEKLSEKVGSHCHAHLKKY
jgi:peptidoglycan hydrolase CwlO-like protein